MYINGHRIKETFAGFQRGNVVGIEMDYSNPSKPALFMWIDGWRVAAIRRELVEGLIPAVVFTGLGHGERDSAHGHVSLKFGGTENS